MLASQPEITSHSCGSYLCGVLWHCCHPPDLCQHHPILMPTCQTCCLLTQFNLYAAVKERPAPASDTAVCDVGLLWRGSILDAQSDVCCVHHRVMCATPLTGLPRMRGCAGEKPDSRSVGPFTPFAEKWNGRIAMLGFTGARCCCTARQAHCSASAAQTTACASPPSRRTGVAQSHACRLCAPNPSDCACPTVRLAAAGLLLVEILKGNSPVF